MERASLFFVLLSGATSDCPSLRALTSTSPFARKYDLCGFRLAYRIKRFLFLRVALSWAPVRPQRGPYTGRGARTDGLVSDRTRKQNFCLTLGVPPISFVLSERGFRSSTGFFQ